MIDIKYLRENPEEVKTNMSKKHREDHNLVDEVIFLDKKFKDLSQESQDLRHKRNDITEKINQLKKDGEDASDFLEKAKEIPTKIKDIEAEQSTVKAKIDEHLLSIPNMMHEDVPTGKDHADNVEVERIGEPVDTNVMSHQEVLEKINGADFESSAETSGNGFYYLQGDVALLNQALLQYAIKVLTEKGFLYVETPYLLTGDIMRNVADLHDQEHMVYKIDGEDLFLIGTSEHSLIGRYVGKIIPELELPIKQTSYSMCFRKEKGSHGLDERGLFRTHQFNKIEMIAICYPEESMKIYEDMKQISIEIFKNLEIPIRVLQICAGDLGDLKHTQVDIEAYSPRRKGYFEVVSCSNLTDAQSQLLKIKVKGKEGNYFPHTINNTAIATSRALVAILENNQTEDGVRIPKVLVPYMGKDMIKWI